MDPKLDYQLKDNNAGWETDEEEEEEEVGKGDSV